MKRFHPGVALLLSLLWEVSWAGRGALPCGSPGFTSRGSAIGRDLELRGRRTGAAARTQPRGVRGRWFIFGLMPLLEDA